MICSGILALGLHVLAEAELPSVPTPWADTTSNTLMQGLLMVLPGFVSVAIIQSLTVRQKQEPLERIIQALLYTFINHVTWQVALIVINTIGWTISSSSNPFWWKPTAMGQLIGLGFCAVIWGILVTWIVNIGWLHDKLRDLGWIRKGLERLRLSRVVAAFPAAMWFGITKRSSRPSEWYDAFYESKNEFVVVHLKDERRIYGWAKIYPDVPTEGHLMICDAEWLGRPPSSVDSPPEPLVRILIDVKDVQFVEFVAAKQEIPNGGQNTAEVTDNCATGVHQEGRGEPETGGSTPEPSGSTTPVRQEVRETAPRQEQ